MEKHAGTDRAKASTKGSRERVEDIHGWRKPLGESLIAALRSIEIVGFPLKYGEDSFRRIASSYLLRERVGNKVFFRLLLVLFQSFIEDRLKVWIGGGHLETGRHRVYGGCERDRRSTRGDGDHVSQAAIRVHCLVYVAYHALRRMRRPAHMTWLVIQWRGH